MEDNVRTYDLDIAQSHWIGSYHPVELYRARPRDGYSLVDRIDDGAEAMTAGGQLRVAKNLDGDVIVAAVRGQARHRISIREIAERTRGGAVAGVIPVQHLHDRLGGYFKRNERRDG